MNLLLARSSCNACITGDASVTDNLSSETVVCFSCPTKVLTRCLLNGVRAREILFRIVTEVFLWVYGVNRPTRRIMENEGLFTNVQENT
ncbi:hypothetical protein AVEN_68616-1 [Araneus ventricosus]|uniref:Uncharacterized protein n=1 Tax=Araneus ventricosus TaxID=182803 RepID=A0A4Y2I3C1_ARAVE|nr:hypothetical protein AVEN_30858-1 [Araneus ventricosus]GBM72260.1 hypothetical protein AVEN_68616-1 [Araneus ventricosus]